MAVITPRAKVLAIWRALLICAAAPFAVATSLLLEPGGSAWGIATGCWVLVFLFFYVWYLPRRLRGLSLRLEEDRITLETGVFQRVTRTVPFQNVQYVTLRASPFHRLYRLTTLVVVAPGGRLAVPGLDREDARRLSMLLFYAGEEGDGGR